MKELLSQILETEDVHGVMLLSFQGKVMFREESTSFSGEGDVEDAWPRFVEALQGVKEADLVFEKIRLYIKRTELGYLVISMGLFAPAAMVRINCDVLLPSLKRQETAKGLKGLFKKRF